MIVIKNAITQVENHDDNKRYQMDKWRIKMIMATIRRISGELDDNDHYQVEKWRNMTIAATIKRTSGKSR